MAKLSAADRKLVGDQVMREVSLAGILKADLSTLVGLADDELDAAETNVKAKVAGNNTKLDLATLQKVMARVKRRRAGEYKTEKE